MFEWWQAILLTVAGALVGGVTTLVVSYFTHQLTTAAARKAQDLEFMHRLDEEARRASTRAEEEERQARREYRKEQMKPVLDFLDLAKRYRARETATRQLESMWEQNVAGIKDKGSLEDLRDLIRKDPVFAGPDFYAVVQAAAVAASTAPTYKMARWVMKVFSNLPPGTQKGGHSIAAVQSVDQLVEDYVTKV